VIHIENELLHRKGRCSTAWLAIICILINKINTLEASLTGEYREKAKLDHATSEDLKQVTPVIAIDGPVASGKGTVARAVAKALGFHMLDSGAIYRAFALSCIEKNINISKFNELSDEAKVLSLNFLNETVIVNGQDATDKIREEGVGMLASKLSAIPEVRAALLARQREFARAPGLVADGRDMGTVVFPDATLKVFLTASSSVRGARRFEQVSKAAARIKENRQEGSISNDRKHLIEKGNSLTISDSLERVIAQIRQRDLQDKTRSTAPLKPAPDAIVIDNAQHGPNETVDAVLSLWKLRHA
jgi:cytidylate kinase